MKHALEEDQTQAASASRSLLLKEQKTQETSIMRLTYVWLFLVFAFSAVAALPARADTTVSFATVNGADGEPLKNVWRLTAKCDDGKSVDAGICRDDVGKCAKQAAKLCPSLAEGTAGGGATPVPQDLREQVVAEASRLAKLRGVRNPQTFFLATSEKSVALVFSQEDPSQTFRRLKDGKSANQALVLTVPRGADPGGPETKQEMIRTRKETEGLRILWPGRGDLPGQGGTVFWPEEFQGPDLQSQGIYFRSAKPRKGWLKDLVKYVITVLIDELWPESAVAPAGGSGGGGTGSSPGTPSGTWTSWLNRDQPGGSGDFETLRDFVAEGKACENPEKIECRTRSGKDWTETGEVYQCVARVGGVCRNSSQPQGKRCSDYEVRFYCP